jgi:hypothetical protein
MDIETLLKLQGKSHAMTEVSHEDIYQAVLDAIIAHENIENSDGDDLDEDGPASVEPPPICRSVLKPLYVGYVSDLNDPISRKLKCNDPLTSVNAVRKIPSYQ